MCVQALCYDCFREKKRTSYVIGWKSKIVRQHYMLSPLLHKSQRNPEGNSWLVRSSIPALLLSEGMARRGNDPSRFAAFWRCGCFGTSAWGDFILSLGPLVMFAQTLAALWSHLQTGKPFRDPLGTVWRLWQWRMDDPLHNDTNIVLAEFGCQFNCVVSSRRPISLGLGLGKVSNGAVNFRRFPVRWKILRSQWSRQCWQHATQSFQSLILVFL